MDDHIIDPEQADALRDPLRYRLCSREELLGAVRGAKTVVDVGSGTGFFTDDIAAVADTVYAVDMQAEMHAHYREHGVPENVELRHADAGDIGTLTADAVVALFSVHELDLETALPAIASVLRPGGRLFVVDWSAAAGSEDGPPQSHRYTAATAAERFSEYFKIADTTERHETFRLEATLPAN